MVYCYQPTILLQKELHLSGSTAGFHILNKEQWGPLMVAQWLRYCATNRKVTGSIPDGVIGIFH
jgi:hypothetical protein